MPVGLELAKAAAPVFENWVPKPKSGGVRVGVVTVRDDGRIPIKDVAKRGAAGLEYNERGEL